VAVRSPVTRVEENEHPRRGYSFSLEARQTAGPELGVGGARMG
jgi:hypothetical protein